MLRCRTQPAMPVITAPTLPTALALLVMLCLAVPAPAQPLSPFTLSASSSPSPSGEARVSFERLLNTYLFTETVIFNALFPAWQVSATQSFRSTLIAFSQPAIRDEHNLRLQLTKPLNQTLAVNLTAAHFLLSDSRSLFRSESVSNTLLAGVSLTPLSEVILASSAGVKSEKQLTQSNTGLVLSGGASLLSLSLAGALVNSEVSLTEEFLNPRRNANRSVRASVDREYESRATLRLSAGYDDQRRDFYSLVGDALTIETRSDRSLYTDDTLSYRLTPNLSSGIRFGLRLRTITRENGQQFFTALQSIYDNEITQSDLTAQTGLGYESQTISASASISFVQQQQTFRAINAFADNAVFNGRERFRDNLLQIASVGFRAAWQQRGTTDEPQHRITLSAQLRGLRYDTPEPTNTDDRDEVSYFFTLQDSLRLNSSLALLTTVSAALTHNVYVFAAQSGNNTWNRVLKFAPATVWRVPRLLENYAEFSVLANYTAYDFESPGSTRSFSFRQFAVFDSAKFFLSDRLTLRLAYEQRLYERAELYWTDFAERPLNSFNDRLALVELDAALGAWLNAGIGVKVFSQERFIYQSAMRTPQAQVLYVGPVTRIVYKPALYAAFEAGGWYQIEFIDGRQGRTTPNLKLSVSAQW